jgi:urease accessory protein
VHYSSGEIFKFDSLVSSFEISVDERPLALDRLVASTPSALQALPRLWRGALHIATVFAYAPDLPVGVEDAVHALEASVDGTELGVSRIDNLIAVRVLSAETWQAHEAIFRVWAALRPSIAGKPARPIRKC